MWTSIMLGLALVVLQKPAPAASTVTPAASTGTVAGKITPPEGLTISKPAVVALLSPEYMEMWNTDVQERMDNYWERFKPTFIQAKELYREVAKMAYRDAFQHIVTMMKRNNRTRSADLVRESTPDGKFEFTNVPVGRYKILASGSIDFQEIVWQDSIEVTNAVPIYIEMKKTIP